MIRKFTDAMREISGFGIDGEQGKRYEQCCRAMVLTGVTWLESNPGADPKFSEIKNVTGIVRDDNSDSEKLTDAMAAAAEPLGGATGAMMHACVHHVMRIKTVGWEQYVAEMEMKGRQRA